MDSRRRLDPALRSVNENRAVAAGSGTPARTIIFSPELRQP
jgi:hypothetical protein